MRSKDGLNFEGSGAVKKYPRVWRLITCRAPLFTTIGSTAAAISSQLGFRAITGNPPFPVVVVRHTLHGYVIVHASRTLAAFFLLLTRWPLCGDQQISCASRGRLAVRVRFGVFLFERRVLILFCSYACFRSRLRQSFGAAARLI